MDITVDGRGTFSLALSDGDLTITLDGRSILRTKGNPTKPGNPDFASIEEAQAYFQTLIFAQPIVADEEGEAV